jgi:hypothetical protein
MSLGLKEIESKIFPCVKKFHDAVEENKRECAELIDAIHKNADVIRQHFIKRGLR